ncbi:hypothetical protein RBSWK_02245 [Rhodopirellula baltica SWK14]|uniref:Uncharacterized protein n=1 Tax=Rhodopirellula baltica SWK14 TaxID=993516 RepID=L7CIN1_RHOBT|nr:hypothetical protein RBSWK_02245 [Rhodopirellula baltica SWK14]
MKAGKVGTFGGVPPWHFSKPPHAIQASRMVIWTPFDPGPIFLPIQDIVLQI